MKSLPPEEADLTTASAGIFLTSACGCALFVLLSFGIPALVAAASQLSK